VGAFGCMLSAASHSPDYAASQAAQINSMHRSQAAGLRVLPCAAPCKLSAASKVTCLCGCAVQGARQQRRGASGGP
jgi:hypothetical protein